WSLLILRVIFEVGCLICLFILKRWTTETSHAVVFFGLLGVMGCSIAQMTVVLGGFSSSYYQGMNLVFFSASVLIPVRWPRHAAIQVMVLAYYYAANLIASRPGGDFRIAVENTFFLLWTCALACSSVLLYERLLREQFHARNALQVSNEKLVALDRLKSEF